MHLDSVKVLDIIKLEESFCHVLLNVLVVNDELLHLLLFLILVEVIGAFVLSQITRDRG